MGLSLASRELLVLFGVCATKIMFRHHDGGEFDSAATPLSVHHHSGERNPAANTPVGPAEIRRFCSKQMFASLFIY